MGPTILNQMCALFFALMGVYVQSTLSEADAMNSTKPTDSTPASNTTRRVDDEVEVDDTGTAVIAACIIIGVVILLALVGACFILRKKRLFQLLAQEKQMQIQMTSARNAGVYQDLTVTVPADDKPPASPEHEKLKAAEEV